ncbi:lipoate--protein ligase family protein [Paenibacillus pasadenensis]|uniref:lipoate--protein ligase family protein n=1 Tax=Paenibacillus pasadenensis TaxID=217090 RepID=UPI00203A883F|nr:lipoate--protein ligase family protein [Paenibacillus pasadenensis]MCM3750318.1 lipoate--protein ligase family protein [Paenibacillus pasadenensis]
MIAQRYPGLLLLDRMDDWAEPNVLHSFALDELLCRRTGQDGIPVLHLWRHPSGFVMGPRDSRLPEAALAARELERLGLSAAVRNSGGAAVPLDPGVVNISLILPLEGAASSRFNDDFQLMYELISAALQDTGVQVDKGEIAGAYCPGDYDLSISGRKFCGIAQRRLSKSYIVQAFVNAGGSGEERGRLVRQFYDTAAGSSAHGISYPQVHAETMGSLEELAGLWPDSARMFAEAVGTAAIGARGDDEARMPDSRMPDRADIAALAATLRARYPIGT